MVNADTERFSQTIGRNETEIYEEKKRVTHTHRVLFVFFSFQGT